MKKILLSVFAAAATFGLYGQNIPVSGLVGRYLFTEGSYNSNSSPTYVNMWDIDPTLTGITSGVNGTAPDGTNDAAIFNGAQENIATALSSPYEANSYSYGMWVNFNGNYSTGTPTLLRVGESLALQIKFISNNPQTPTNPGGNTTQGVGNPNELVSLTVLHHDSESGWVGFADNTIYEGSNVNNLLSNPFSWFHLAVTYTGNPTDGEGTMKIYINGQYSFSYVVPHAAITPNETYPNGIRTIRIGGDITGWNNNGPVADPNRFFNGRIDDVYIYNTTLSDNEVAAIYTSGLANAPVVEWATDSLYICGNNDGGGQIEVYTTEPGSYNVTWKRNGVDILTEFVTDEQYLRYTPTQPGTYSCVISNTIGPVVGPDIEVVALNLFDLSIVVNTDNTLGLSAPPTPFSDYQLVVSWYKDGVLLGTGNTIPVDGLGTYSAEIAYVGEGTFCENTLTILYTALEENVADKLVSLFPNPTNGVVTINSSTAISAINIYDVAGSLVYSGKPAPGTINLNVENLANGFYTLSMNTDKGVITKKLIKQ